MTAPLSFVTIQILLGVSSFLFSGAVGMADSSILEAKAEHMRTTTHDFCTSFASGMPGPECLDNFFTEQPSITEHGPSWAVERLPFLANTFSGRRRSGGETGKTCDDYYDLLTSTLAVEPGSVVVPPKESLAVDAALGIVTVELRAEFKSVKTEKSWKEKFVYVLSDFDEDGKRIGAQQLWADPLSAWVAVGDGNATSKLPTIL